MLGMTQQPDTPPQPKHRGTDAFFDSIRGIGVVRSSDRWVGGVAGGLARRFGVDPLLVRGLFGVSILLGGLGLVLYGIAWLLLPEQADGRIHGQQLLRGDVDVAVLGAAAAIITGLSVPDSWGPWFFPGQLSWWRGVTWLGAVGLVVVIIVASSRRRDRSPSQPWPPAPMGPSAPPPPTPMGTAPRTTYPTGGTMTTSETLGADDTTNSEPTETTVPETGTPGEIPQEPTAAPPAGPAQGWTSWQAAPGGPGWQGGPGGPGWSGPGGPNRWTPPPPPSNLPRPPRAERGPGGAVLGVVTALTLLVLAGLLYAARMDWFHGPVALTTVAAAVALIGLGIVVAGLRGRRGGGFTALAIVGLLVAAPMAAAADWSPSSDLVWVNGVRVGQIEERPTTVADAEAGVRLGAGDARIDLTQVPLDGTSPVDVPIRAGAGDVTIVLPANASVTAHVELGAGDVWWLGSKESLAGGSGRNYATADAGPVQIAVDVRMGVGNVTFVKES
jgi:phage shock protein PspC (stress-responsive transcriptional regulator)